MDRLTIFTEPHPLFPGKPCWDLIGTDRMTCDEICNCRDIKRPDGTYAGCEGCIIDQAFTKLAMYEDIDPDPAKLHFKINYQCCWMGFAVGVILMAVIQYIANYLI